MLTRDLEDSMQRLIEFSHAQGPIRIRRFSALNFTLGAHQALSGCKSSDKTLDLFAERIKLPDKFCWEDIDIKMLVPFFDFGYRECQHAP
jgi:hypothetical protein